MLTLRMAGDLGQIRPMQWDPHDLSTIRNVIRGSNVVINLVGNRMETKRYSFHDTNVNVVKAITQVAKEEGIEQFIHVSMLGAKLGHESVQLHTKAEGEEVVRKAFPDAVIVRPATMFGVDDYFWWRLAHYVNYNYKSPFFPFYNLDRKVQMVAGLDVAEAIVQIVKNGAETAGGTYELGGPKVWTMRECWERVAHLMEKSMIVKEVPFWLMAEVAKLNQWLPRGFRNGKKLDYDEVVRWKSDDILSSRQDMEERGVRGFEDLNMVPKPIESQQMQIVYEFRSEYEWGYEDAILKQQRDTFHTNPSIRKY